MSRPQHRGLPMTIIPPGAQPNYMIDQSIISGCRRNVLLVEAVCLWCVDKDAFEEGSASIDGDNGGGGDTRELKALMVLPRNTHRE